MELPAPEAIAVLRAEAEAGLREDAAAPAAAAREELLQIYRDRLRVGDWGDEDAAALFWIDTLAQAGHVGATRLRDRILDSESGARTFLARFPARLKAYGLKSFWPALVSAQHECTLANPNPEDIWVLLLRDWNSRQAGSSSFEERSGAYNIARAFFDLQKTLVTFSRNDMAALGKLLQRDSIRSTADWRRAKAKLRFQIAIVRLNSADEGERASGERLLNEVANLGSSEAVEEYYRRHPGKPLQPDGGMPSQPASPEQIGELRETFELAASYLEIGDNEGARELLVEILRRGSPSEQERARAMLRKCEAPR